MAKIENFSDIYKYQHLTGELTYKQLAKKTRSTEQAVKYWASGARVPNGSVLQCLEWYITSLEIEQHARAQVKKVVDHYEWELQNV